MFSTLLTIPRAPLSRSHSTALMKKLEFEGCETALVNEIRAGTRATSAAVSTIRRARRQPPGRSGPSGSRGGCR